MRQTRFLIIAGTVALGVAICALLSSLSAQEPKNQDGLTVEQARREVRMLDDLYKTAVIYINDTYVENEGSHAAALAARVRIARDEMRALPRFDYVVVNRTGRLQETVGDILAIFTAEKCRVHPRRLEL